MAGNNPGSADNSLLIRLIIQFFDDIEFTGSKRALLLECEVKKVNVLLEQKNPKKQPDLLKIFEIGDYEKFFRIWKSLAENQGKETEKLEFYFRLYFATYPLRNSNVVPIKKRTDYMDQLKKYLELPSTLKLSENAELTPYYALPYVKKLDAHPLFKELLQPEWVDEIKDRLKSFLKETMNKNDGVPPCSLTELLHVYTNHRKKPINEDYVSEVQRKYESYRRRNASLQADYHKIILVASELVDSLEQTIKGNPISSKHLQDLCARMLESKDNEQRLLNASPNVSLSKAPDDPEPTKSRNAADSVDDFVKLNFIKLKLRVSAVLNADCSALETALIFQALRWVITRNRNEVRNVFVQNMINFDIFALGDNEEEIFPKLFQNSNVVREQTCRLMNVFASLKAGRSYLMKSSCLLTVLNNTVQLADVTKMCTQHIVATLQKLSVRRCAQMQLIKENFLPWLLNYLDNYTSLSEYGLEYACALLMNLSLTTKGKKAATTDPDHILNLLNALLKLENKAIRPYINGTLYSVLSLPNLRHKAKKTDLCVLLDKAVQHPKTPSDVKQIPFVIKQLNGELVDKQPPPSDDEEMSTTEEDEDEEDDYLEADLNADDKLEPTDSDNNLSGLPLLYFCFPPEQRRHSSHSEHLVVSQTNVSSYPTKSSRLVTKKANNNKWAMGGNETFTVERVEKSVGVRQEHKTEDAKSQNKIPLSSATFTVSDTMTRNLPKSVIAFKPNARKIERSGNIKRVNAAKSKLNATTSALTKTSTKNSDLQATPDVLLKSASVVVVGDKSTSPLLATENAGKSVNQKPIMVSTSSSGDNHLPANSKSKTLLHNSTKLSTANQIKAQDFSGVTENQLTHTISAISGSVVISNGQARKNSLQNIKVDFNKQNEGINEESLERNNPKSSLTSEDVFVPGLVERVNTRIPEDTSAAEYLTAFGSRPKVARTPDKEGSRRKNGAHFMVF